MEEDYNAKICNEVDENNLKNVVQLLGSRLDIHNICVQAHIGVLASEHEGSPLVLLEYGFAGLPIVSSDISVCKRILKDGLYGHLFTNGDVEDLAGKMLEVYQEYKEAIENADHFKENVLKTYGPEASVKGIVQVIEAVAKHE